MEKPLVKRENVLYASWLWLYIYYSVQYYDLQTCQRILQPYVTDSFNAVIPVIE